MLDLMENPLVNILYSQHFFARYCVDTVRRNYVLVTPGIGKG